MLRYVYGEDESVARFVAQLIPHVDRGFPLPYQAIGVIDDNDRLIAGAVYYYWNKKNGTIEIATAALPNTVWFTRLTLRHMAEFAFKKCDCQMAIMRVRADNEPLLHQLKRFGCEFIKVPRLYGRSVDGVMCLLTAEAYAEHPALHRVKEMA